uniref:Family with sequence similarity 81 member B n=1 Tax=Scophthalmus maximus TaxID=52904 RepID=A0A8D3CWX9_SCOMX
MHHSRITVGQIRTDSKSQVKTKTTQHDTAWGLSRLEKSVNQERTLAVLLEQAFAIKEEVAAGLQSTKGSVQVEALSRKLLESHILTVTHIVKQLSRDIQALQRQIALRDSVSSGTTLAVQSLDQKNMAGIGDLRGRVARYAHKSWVKHCLQTLRYNRRWLQQRHACQRNIWRATPAEV